MTCCCPVTDAGRKADIWSLGCTVLEMLSGKHPWPDHDNQWAVMLAITQTETGPPRPPGISPVLSDFLDKCFKVCTSCLTADVPVVCFIFSSGFDGHRADCCSCSVIASDSSGTGNPVCSHAVALLQQHINWINMHCPGYS